MERVLQELVWRRAGDSCEYCQIPQKYERIPFEIDHIIAEDHEGPTKASNLCLCCFACNRYKGPNIAGIDPKTRKIVPLSIPDATNGRAIFDGMGLCSWEERPPQGRRFVSSRSISIIASNSGKN